MLLPSWEDPLITAIPKWWIWVHGASPHKYTVSYIIFVSYPFLCFDSVAQTGDSTPTPFFYARWGDDQLPLRWLFCLPVPWTEMCMKTPTNRRSVSRPFLCARWPPWRSCGKKKVTQLSTTPPARWDWAWGSTRPCASRERCRSRMESRSQKPGE